MTGTDVRVGSYRQLLNQQTLNSVISVTVEFGEGIDIGIYTTNFENEFISLTDIAKYRNEDDPRLGADIKNN